MIKKLIKWFYLIASGLSFAIMIFLLWAGLYFYIAKDEFKHLVSYCSEYNANNELTTKIKTTTDYPEIKSETNSENPNTRVESLSKLQKEGELKKINIREYENNYKKIYFKTKNNGHALLRPSKIVYIETDKSNNSNTIVTVTNKRILLSNRIYSLKKIEELLNNQVDFFRLNSFIVNCNYIEQIISANTGVSIKHYIKFENNDTIPLPEDKLNRLLEVLQISG